MRRGRRPKTHGTTRASSISGFGKAHAVPKQSIGQAEETRNAGRKSSGKRLRSKCGRRTRTTPRCGGRKPEAGQRCGQQGASHAPTIEGQPGISTGSASFRTKVSGERSAGCRDEARRALGPASGVSSSRQWRARDHGASRANGLKAKGRRSQATNSRPRPWGSWTAKRLQQYASRGDEGSTQVWPYARSKPSCKVHLTGAHHVTRTSGAPKGQRRTQVRSEPREQPTNWNLRDRCEAGQREGAADESLWRLRL